MKITLKSECVANDRAFKDCTVGAIYEAEFCENPPGKSPPGRRGPFITRRDR